MTTKLDVCDLAWQFVTYQELQVFFLQRCTLGALVVKWKKGEVPLSWLNEEGERHRDALQEVRKNLLHYTCSHSHQQYGRAT